MTKKSMSKIIAIVTSAAMLVSYSGSVVNVLAASNANNNKTTLESNINTTKDATVSKFDLYGTSQISEYNKVFKMDNENILSISNNGGNYSGSPIGKAIDGNLNTHWETGKANSAQFTNEIVFHLNETTELNRIVYAARQSSAKGKGFAQEFEIYSSTTDEGDDFTLVSSGEYKGSTGDVVEIQFAKTEFKRIKFVFKKANQDWASAAEISFYKEDRVKDTMKKLFTDNTFSQISEEYNDLGSLNKLDDEARKHPLYSQYKEDIENAKILINAQKEESTTAVTIPFNHYSYEDYSNFFRMGYENIKSIRNNAGHYGGAVIGNAVDGNLDTYWETNTSNSNNFTNEVEVEFKETVELNRIIYGARKSDCKGFAEEFEIYASKTSKGDTYELVTTGKHNMVAGLVEVKFEPTSFKRVKFKFKKSNQNWATLSELAFYKEDALEDKIKNLFTNGLMNELKAEFASLSEINKLEAQANNHPLHVQFQDNINMAKEILSNGNVSNEDIVTASQRGNSSTEASQHQIARTSFSLDTLGRYVVPGETFQVYVDADELGVMPNLILGQIADDRNGWARRYALKPGLNTITAPSFETMRPGVAYVENAALPSEQAYAPRVRIVGGTTFPVYYHGKTDPAEYKKELEDYVAKISTDDSDFANGNPKDVVYNVTELISENNTISTSAAGALKGIKELEPIGKTVSDTMDEWEIMWKEFQKISGAVEDDPDPKNQFFNAKFTSRVFTKGPYGWSDWGYTGYNGGNSAKRDEGFFKQIVKPFSVPGNDGWAYYHEWGHNINNSTMEHTEVTNNIYSVILRKIFNNSDDDRVDWNSLYKRFSGEKVNHGYWTYLGILEQIQYYYGEDSYGKASRIARTNPDGIMNGLGSNLQRLVIGLSLATETDLTDFFEDWGYVNATDKMKEKITHLPKPDVKLEYMNSLGRNYKGSGFTKDAKVDISSILTNKEKNEIKLEYNIDVANKEASMGYEILRDGKVVGYTTSTSFVDRNIDTNASHLYEIVAYDKKLNASNGTTMSSKQPIVNTNPVVTVELGEEFDSKDFVTATDYDGEDLTNKIEVVSGDVDTHKKGSYEVTYRVTNENKITSEGKATINVVSKKTYASDLNWTSATTDYNQVRKDKSSTNAEIGLYRNGTRVGYSKGIGTHANSEVVYDITNKNYEYFETYIGVDQALAGNKNSSVIFKVQVDGEEVYNSGLMKSDTDQLYVKVPVSGASVVKLILDNSGNGNAADHGDWADAKFVSNNAKPTLSIPEEIVSLKLHEKFDVLKEVKAFDAEDGDLLKQVEVKTNGFNSNKTGTYNVEYTVTDSDGNTISKTRKIVVYSGTTFLSNINWDTARTDYGIVRKDKSSTNSTIKLLVNGETKEFEKGIGTHANSETVYNLAGSNYEYFETYVGVDRNITEQNNSSITFKIVADGKEVYDSGLMKYNTEAKLVKIPVKGVNELKLVVDNAGNGNTSDHGSFGDAKFLVLNSVPILTIPKSVSTKVGQEITLTENYSATDAEDGDLTSKVEVTGEDKVNFERAGEYPIEYTVTDSEGNTVTKTRTVAVVNMEDYKYLSNYDWQSTQNSYTAPKKDISMSGKTLRLTDESGNEVAYEKGIGAHSTSTIVYDLTDKSSDYFTSFIGVDRQMYGSVGSVKFEVYVDGEKKFESGLMNSRDPQKFVEVDINEAKELKLVVTDGGNGNGSDHATWGNAKLHFANADRLFTKDLEKAIEEAKVVDKEKYTFESLEALKIALTKAEEILANKKATQKEVDAAVEELKMTTEGLIEIDLTKIITIKDKYLSNSIKKTLGLTGDITLGDMHKLTTLTSESRRARSLEGIEHAKNLVTLDIAGNEITDFSPLKGLTKLENLIADPQFIEFGELKGSVVENQVIGIDGKKVRPYLAGISNTLTNKEVVFDVNQWEQNPDKFTIDISGQEKGLYWLSLSYKVENNLVHVLYLINNK